MCCAGLGLAAQAELEAAEASHAGCLKPQIDDSYWCSLDHSLRFLRIELHEEIVELARQLTGRLPGGDEDIYYRNGGINELAPGRCFKWHRDSGDEATEFMHYFSDASQADGCLRVVPGSHHEQRIFEHEHDMRNGLVLRDMVRADHITSEPVDVELEPGQMSLHDIYLIHGSNANRSDKRRAGVAIRYMPATSLFDRSLIERSDNSGFTVDFSTRPLWLLRGRDRAAAARARRR